MRTDLLSFESLNCKAILKVARLAGASQYLYYIYIYNREMCFEIDKILCSYFNNHELVNCSNIEHKI